MPSDEELLDALRTALAPARVPDPARVAALRASVAERAAVAAASPVRPVALIPPAGPRRRWRVPMGIGIGAAAAAAAFVLGGALAHRDDPVRADHEFAATLVAPEVRALPR